MDVDSFIEKYRPEWQWLDQKTYRGSRGLQRLTGDELSEVMRLYLRVSAHLAEVQTRYRDYKLESYLTGIIGRSRAAIYGSRTGSLSGFARLFGSRYRQAISRTRPFIIAMAATFLIVAFAMTLWVSNSPEAQTALVPPGFREAAEDATGDRTIDAPSTVLSTFIMFNNIRVAFLAFALGITVGIGTGYVVIMNGVLLGAIAGLFHDAGKAGVFWSLILPHGLLEIVAICIAAGAGLRIGWSIIQPGDRPRSSALAEESADAVLVVIGVIPAFIVAGLIEGFLTGSPYVPAPVEIAIGVLLAGGYVLFLFTGFHRRPRALIRR